VNIFQFIIYFYLVTGFEEKTYNKKRVLNSSKELQKQIQATIDGLTLTEEANSRTIDDLTNTEKPN
jgi:hypothetical protein